MEYQRNHLDKPRTLDYLAVGHLTEDLTNQGPVMGGTVAYSALTAKAFGLNVGMITACSPDMDFSALNGIQILALPSKDTTTFENIQNGNQRRQYLHLIASKISPETLPKAWINADIVHLGPVVNEIDRNFFEIFPNSFLGITPQGWLRGWGDNHKVFYEKSEDLDYILKKSSAVVLSMEDVNNDETTIEEMADIHRVLVVTEGGEGARIYWNGDVRRIRPPDKNVVDTTGAGDIFAAAFFIRLKYTQDPWEAARLATLVAAESVTRKGIESIPTPGEIKTYTAQVIKKK